MTDDTKHVGFDPFWEGYLKGEIRPQIETIVRVVKEKIVPMFAQAEREANDIEQQILHATVYSENVDYESIAEYAFEKGLEHYILLTDLTYGILNMFAASLYHLFEQHLIMLYRKEFVHPSMEIDPNNISLKAIKKELKVRSIYIACFTNYPKIMELKSVCNCIKHGDGHSCEKVKKSRADLFEFPHFRGQDILSLPTGSIITPLAGDSLRISEQDFEEYAQTVLSFFEELFETNRRIREEAGYPPPF